MPVRFRYLIFLLLLPLVFALQFGRAQVATDTSHWSFRAWQTEDGLPDNSVTGVAQTADGYLWVATYGGLMRFNGTSFSAVPLPSLLKKSVRAMLIDPHGNFWLGMDSGAVICLEANKVRTFGTADGLSAERITSMALDREGAIWIIS